MCQICTVIKDYGTSGSPHLLKKLNGIRVNIISLGTPVKLKKQWSLKVSCASAVKD